MKNRGQCFECDHEAHEDHHVVPKSAGGTRTVPVCSDCHSLIHDLGRQGDHRLITQRAVRALRDEGRVYGALPFGFQNENGFLVVDKTEQATLARISRMRKTMSLEAIAKRLNESSTPTKRGGIWHASTVRCVLRTKERLRHIKRSPAQVAA